jgi:hypothetical protein
MARWLHISINRLPPVAVASSRPRLFVKNVQHVRPSLRALELFQQKERQFMDRHRHPPPCRTLEMRWKFRGRVMACRDYWFVLCASLAHSIRADALNGVWLTSPKKCRVPYYLSFVFFSSFLFLFSLSPLSFCHSFHID